MRNILLAVAIGAVSIAAFGFDKDFEVEKSIELKDGSTVHIFKDGKMGMEGKNGQPIYMKPGEVMETKDGKKIIMKGNEVWRVDELLNKHFR